MTINKKFYISVLMSVFLLSGCCYDKSSKDHHIETEKISNNLFLEYYKSNNILCYNAFYSIYLTDSSHFNSLLFVCDKENNEYCEYVIDSTYLICLKYKNDYVGSINSPIVKKYLEVKGIDLKTGESF